MAYILADSVGETTTTTGTGALTLAGATFGRRAFGDVMADKDTAIVRIQHTTEDEWEVVEVEYDSGSNALKRNSVLVSSNSNSAVNFSAGTKIVEMVVSATDFGRVLNVIDLIGPNPPQRLLGYAELLDTLVVVSEPFAWEPVGVEVTFTVPASRAIEVVLSGTGGLDVAPGEGDVSGGLLWGLEADSQVRDGRSVLWMDIEDGPAALFQQAVGTMRFVFRDPAWLPATGEECTLAWVHQVLEFAGTIGGETGGISDEGHIAMTMRVYEALPTPAE